ncbi:MAG: hypothetical protein CM1200mP24_08870 [Gammaproteobacteria bacterium]|nr:MAG: hypothetical protein CM1200mP24_08870 [Gammaproteobacteria bacterium]
MPFNPDAVGATGGPVTRSWTSKDALLYAVGVGAGLDELQFTTENTKNTPQKVLPTMAVILGGGGALWTRLEISTEPTCFMVNKGIELLDEIPAEGKIESTGKIAGPSGTKEMPQWWKRFQNRSMWTPVKRFFARDQCCFFVERADGVGTVAHQRKLISQKLLPLTK